MKIKIFKLNKNAPNIVIWGYFNFFKFQSQKMQNLKYGF